MSLKLSAALIPLLLLVSTLGCPSNGQEDPPLVRERGRCPQGFFEAEGGRYCEPWIPVAACPPGSMPRLGDEDCVPVGHRDCAEGFEPDPSGMGCRDVLPPHECGGFTREALGETVCRPVGDCSLPFPPDDATHLVDQALSADDPGQGRFRTLEAAIAAAGDGAIIAVAPGYYRESLRIEKNVSLIGKCPAEVSVRPPRSGATGVYIPGPNEVHLRGLTILGFVGGVMAQGGASVRLSQVVIEGNQWIGVLSGSSGTTISLVDSLIKRTVPEPSEDPWGIGLAAYQGGALQLDSVTVVESTGVGIYVTSPGSTAQLIDTVVLRTKLDDAGGNNAGIYMQNRGHLQAERLVVADNHSMGMVLFENDTRAALSHAVVRDSRLDGDGSNGLGIGVWQGASIELADVTLSGNSTVSLHLSDAAGDVERMTVRSTNIPDLPIQFGTERLKRTGAGVVVNEGAQLNLRDSEISDSVIFGLFAAGEGSRVTVDSSSFADTKGDVPLIWGTGVSVLDDARAVVTNSSSMGNDGVAALVAAGARLDVVDSVLLGDSHATQPYEAVGLAVNSGAEAGLSRVAIVDFQIAGILMFGEESVCRFTDGVVARTRTREGEDAYGFNAGIIDGAHIHLRNSEIRDGERTGLSFWGGSGTIEGGAILDNQIAINVEQGTTVSEVASASGDPAPLEVRVTTATKFEGNETKLGASALVVPPSPLD